MMPFLSVLAGKITLPGAARHYTPPCFEGVGPLSEDVLVPADMGKGPDIQFPPWACGIQEQGLGISSARVNLWDL